MESKVHLNYGRSSETTESLLTLLPVGVQNIEHEVSNSMSAIQFS